jgi:hypothetical protein
MCRRARLSLNNSLVTRLKLYGALTAGMDSAVCYRIRLPTTRISVGG